MEINIRRADINDVSLISALSTITFLDTFTGTCTDEDIHQFVEKYFNEEQVFKELQDPRDFYGIASDGNKAMGYLRFKEAYSVVPVIRKYKGIELKRIYVLKQYHDKTVGAALMEFALRFAQENGFEAVWLSVWEHNYKAIAFYKKWGFQDTGYTNDFPIGNTPQTDYWFIKVLEEG